MANILFELINENKTDEIRAVIKKNKTYLNAYFMVNDERGDMGQFNALLWAAYTSNVECVKLLIELGADPSKKVRDSPACGGKTALDFAKDLRNDQIIQLLDVNK
eukprot:TRINITY_DN1738_c0_g1_i2.p1 TRINITY_DN1738_c0_g1~~TRINITY_DN1738_c0_g1_i2.p1  ORF type:complete len:105 (-),score=8.46 TRINITY_DN1738_c0_g1_i2:54-368(-)